MISKDFRKALNVHMVEVSPVLKEKQQDALRIRSTDGIAVQWHTTLESVPQGPSIFIAQEFFDALPVHQFKYTEKGWCEVLVDLDTTIA
jgi:NADH dehydrogenase [ubiquinone] 1 alpha subcomplex assembly factor 7